MQNLFSPLLEQFLKRCPRTGRIRGLRFDSIAARIMFPLLGILAIGWFLVRVIPKPSRAAYPCQKVAAGIGTGFLAYLAAMLATFTTFRFLHKRAGRAAAAAFMAALAVVCYHGMAVSKPAAEEKAVQILTPKEGPNKPMGKARGIYPGRVVWEQDFAAASWDGESGRWWEDRNTDQGEIDKMFSKSLQSLTGAKSDKQAWESLFTYHNQSAGRGSRGYRKGEKVIVKLNCNADDGKPWDNRGYPAPKVVSALVRQLIENAGVPGGAIVLTDPSRMVGDNIYNKIRSNAGADYQQVIFEGQNGGPAPQRVKPAPDMDDPIYFEMPGGKKATLYLPKSYAEATYMINYGLMRPHRVFGVTLAGKNHYGSVYDTELKIFKPTVLHAFALWDYPTPNKLGEAHGLPVLLGHKNTGGKTLLYFLDGLYTSYDQSRPVVKWASLNGRWFASILMSQDPIAMDSVAYDLITSEPNLTKGNPSFNGNVDNYLHESALADNPPSKARYDPENDGKTLKTLGVHEHWNNATEKKYSRNLGRKDGIELIALK